MRKFIHVVCIHNFACILRHNISKAPKYFRCSHQISLTRRRISPAIPLYGYFYIKIYYYRWYDTRCRCVKMLTLYLQFYRKVVLVSESCFVKNNKFYDAINGLSFYIVQKISRNVIWASIIFSFKYQIASRFK